MALLGTIKDDFEDGVLAAQWSSSHGGTDEVAGRARVPSGTGYPALATPSEHTLAGTSVYARLYPAGPGTSTTATSEMVVDDGAGTRVIIVADTVTGNIQFRNDVGYGDAAGVSIAYDATAHAWWRMREATGTVYLETSPDAATWTIRRQFATPTWITDGLNPLIFSTHRDLADAGLYLEVDNVNTTGPLPVPKAGEVAFSSWAAETDFSKSNTTDVTVSGDNLSITANGNYSFVATKVRHDLTGSHFGSTLVTPPNVGNGSVQSHIQVQADANNFIILGWEAGNLRTEVKVAGTSSYGTAVAYSATNHKYLRIREAAGTVFYEASADGTTWTQPIASIAAPFKLTSVDLRIQAGNYNAEPTPGNAIWGAVNTYVSAGPDQTVNPWATVTLTGTGAATWSQVSGTAVTLTGTGDTVTFTAPPSMSAHSLVFAYGSDQMTVNVRRSPHGIKQADGTIRPVRLTRKV